MEVSGQSDSKGETGANTRRLQVGQGRGGRKLIEKRKKVTRKNWELANGGRLYSLGPPSEEEILGKDHLTKRKTESKGCSRPEGRKPLS